MLASPESQASQERRETQAMLASPEPRASQVKLADQEPRASKVKLADQEPRASKVKMADQEPRASQEPQGRMGKMVTQARITIQEPPNMCLRPRGHLILRRAAGAHTDRASTGLPTAAATAPTRNSTDSRPL